MNCFPAVTSNLRRIHRVSSVVLSTIIAVEESGENISSCTGKSPGLGPVPTLSIPFVSPSNPFIVAVTLASEIYPLCSFGLS